MKYQLWIGWLVWCLLLVGLAVARAFSWIAAPAWVLVVFGFMLLVFGLVWWAFGRERPLPLLRDDE